MLVYRLIGFMCMCWEIFMRVKVVLLWFDWGEGVKG